jgi:hypothetical protein
MERSLTLATLATEEICVLNRYAAAKALITVELAQRLAAAAEVSGRMTADKQIEYEALTQDYLEAIVLMVEKAGSAIVAQLLSE